MSTDDTERTSSWSATAATGRFSGSSTSTRTRAPSGRSAPRQRRGRNGLIGVSAISGALIGVKLVHENPDGAAVHAVDRLARLHEPVQGLQHEPVAAERDDDLGVFGRHVAIAGGEPFERVTRLRDRAGDEGYPLEALGRG